MGNATSELTNSLHLLGHAELRLQLFPLADVDNERDGLDFATSRRKRGNADQNGNPTAILAKELFLPRRSTPRTLQLLNCQLIRIAVFGRGQSVPAHLARK